MRSLFQHVFGRRPPLPSEERQQAAAPAPEEQGQQGGGAWDEAEAKAAPVRPVPWQRGGLNLRPTDMANLARWCVLVCVVRAWIDVLGWGHGSSAMCVCVCVRAVF